MEFEKFIETDIGKFLDSKAAELANQAAIMREEEFSMFEITSDYTKELNDALKEGNVVKAKQILEEVKDKYMQATDGTISKKRLYNIMEGIYEQIKDFEQGGGGKSLHETIREYEEKGLFSKPELFQKNDEDSVGLITTSIAMKEKEIEDLTGNGASAQDLEKAARAYSELKELVIRIPESHIDLKTKASERALNWYNTIRKIKSEKYDSKKKSAVGRGPEADVRNLEDRLATIREVKEDIILTHRQIDQALADKNLRACIDGYRKLKGLCESFPKELSEERVALLAEAYSIYEQVRALEEELAPELSAHESEADESPPQGEMAAGRPAPEKQDPRHVDSVQKIRDDITISERRIDEFLAQADVKAAMKEYTRLKLLCKIFPKEPNPQEKVTILAGALGTYDRIRKAKAAIEQRRKASEQEKYEQAVRNERFDGFRRELGERIGHVRQFLAQKDSQSAIREYAKLKEFFNMYPDEPFDQKRTLYDDIMNAHLDMSLLDKDFKGKSVVQSGAKVNEILGTIEQAKGLVDKGMHDDATHMLLEAKHKILLLPKEDFDQKYNLMKVLDEMEHKVVFSSNLQGLDARAEAAK